MNPDKDRKCLKGTRMLYGAVVCSAYTRSSPFACSTTPILEAFSRPLSPFLQQYTAGFLAYVRSLVSHNKANKTKASFGLWAFVLGFFWSLDQREPRIRKGFLARISLPPFFRTICPWHHHRRISSPPERGTINDKDCKTHRK